MEKWEKKEIDLEFKVLKETNAEKKSQQNSHCPDIANPNRMQ